MQIIEQRSPGVRGGTHAPIPHPINRVSRSIAVDLRDSMKCSSIVSLEQTVGQLVCRSNKLPLIVEFCTMCF
jgi:hypothetical protein